MMKQAKNNVIVEGILSEIDIELGSFQKDGRDIECARGSVLIKVEQEINEKMTSLDVPVHMFAYKFKNDGNPNPAYTSILNIKDNFTSIAACGDENLADRIRFNNASISMNEYVGNNGNIVSYPRVSGNFPVKVRREEFSPKAVFEIHFVVVGQDYEVDREGVETGRYKIQGALPQYGNKVDLVPFFISNKKAIDVISNYWNIGDTVAAQGKLDFSSKIVKSVVPSDFGEPIETSRTTNVSDLIITGGTSAPLEDELAYDMEDISAGLAERKRNLEEKKTKKPTVKPAISDKPAPAKDFSGLNDLGF